MLSIVQFKTINFRDTQSYMGIDYSLGIHIDCAKVVNMRKRERTNGTKFRQKGRWKRQNTMRTQESLDRIGWERRVYDMKGRTCA